MSERSGTASVADDLAWSQLETSQELQANPPDPCLGPFGHDERLCLNAQYPSIGQSRLSVSRHLSKLSHIVRRVRQFSVSSPLGGKLHVRLLCAKEGESHKLVPNNTGSRRQFSGEQSKRDTHFTATATRWVVHLTLAFPFLRALS